jgi:hypothetical protein
VSKEVIEDVNDFIAGYRELIIRLEEKKKEKGLR